MAQGIVAIAGGGLRAEISEQGAELQSLRDDAGADFLWDGDPAFWKGRAPLLFPMVGRANGDALLIEGRRYPLRQHGFARNSRFEATHVAADRCTFTLAANDETRASYPFEFRLDATYALADGALAIEIAVANDGAAPMPASFGFHPAFRWPLPGASGRSDHAITFERAETAPIRRLADGLLSEEKIPTPVVGQRLALDDALFAQDALVFDEIASRSVTYTAPGAKTIEIDFPAMPQLGVWSKPGAGFVCIEPWRGFASPAGFDGEFAQRPGVVTIAPGAKRRFAMRIAIRG